MDMKNLFESPAGKLNSRKMFVDLMLSDSPYWYDVYKWCQNEYSTWKYRQMGYQLFRFYFNSEEDKVKFILKWI